MSQLYMCLGETIITPIYMCLKKRGVKFKFFHKVTALHKSGNEISAIDIDVQAHPIKGEYEPLRKLQTPKYKDPFYVWGSAPDLSQLKEKDKVIQLGFFFLKSKLFFLIFLCCLFI